MQQIEIRTSPDIRGIPDLAYAVLRDDEDPIDAVVRSIERRTSTRCYNCALVSETPDGCKIYIATFVYGRPLRGGGYSVAFERRIYV